MTNPGHHARWAGGALPARCGPRMPTGRPQHGQPPAGAPAHCSGCCPGFSPMLVPSRCTAPFLCLRMSAPCRQHRHPLGRHRLPPFPGRPDRLHPLHRRHRAQPGHGGGAEERWRPAARRGVQHGLASALLARPAGAQLASRLAPRLACPWRSWLCRAAAGGPRCVLSVYPQLRLPSRRVVTESCFATQQCVLYDVLSTAKPVISIEYCDAAVVRRRRAWAWGPGKGRGPVPREGRGGGGQTAEEPKAGGRAGTASLGQAWAQSALLPSQSTGVQVTGAYAAGPAPQPPSCPVMWVGAWPHPPTHPVRHPTRPSPPPPPHAPTTAAIPLSRFSPALAQLGATTQDPACFCPRALAKGWDQMVKQHELGAPGISCVRYCE